MIRKPAVAAAYIIFVFAVNFIAYGEQSSYDGYRKIETDHFVFIFEPANLSAAERLSGIAEDAYRKITSFYGSYPETVYCVIDGRSDMYASYYSPLPAHIRVSVHGPTWPTFSPRNGDWLELVFIHELTHYIQLNYDSGIFNYLSHIFGPALHAIPGTLLPTWAVEGPGVLAETLFTAGGRGDSEHFEMLSKAVADVFFSFSRAGSSTVFEPEQRPYVAGYLVSEHIRRVYGDDSLKLIQREFVKFPFFGPSRAIRKITGKSAKGIFEDVVKEVQARSDGYKNHIESEQITPNVYGDYYLPQPTGRGWITYRYTHDLAAGLVLFNPETGEEEILVTTGLTDPSSFSVDPAGSTIAYTSQTGAKTAGGSTVYSDLYLFDTNSAEETQITYNSRLWHPAINPSDGSIVAVTGTGNESYLVSVNPQTGDLQVLFRRNNANVYNPVFSEGGDQLYFVMNTGGMQDIWVLPYPLEPSSAASKNADGEVNAALAGPVTGPDRAGEFFPRISNGRLVYASDRGGDLAVYAQQENGGPRVLAAEDPVGAYAGFLDGKEVIYATYTAAGYALKRCELSGFAAASLNGAVSKPGDTPVDPPALKTTPEADSPPDSMEASPAAQSIYRDIPRFLFWAPLPFTFTPPGGIEIGSGAGVYAAGESTLGDNTIAAAVMFDWNSMGPIIDVTGTIGYRKTLFGYDLYYSQGTDSAGNSLSYLDADVSAGIPLAYRRRFPDRLELRLIGAAGFNFERSFDTVFESSPLQYQEVLQANATAGVGLYYTASRSGARKDFFDPLRFSAWTGAGATMPLLKPADTQVRLSAGNYGQLPSFFKHQVAGIGIDIDYYPTARPAEDPYPVFMPPYTILEMTAAFDYRFHIALLDLPLPYGYSLNHLAGSVFIESLAFVGETGFEIQPYLYPGIEIVTGFGSVSHIPVGFGVRFKIHPGSLTDGNPIKETYMYATAGRGGFENRPRIVNAYE